MDNLSYGSKIGGYTILHAGNIVEYLQNYLEYSFSGDVTGAASIDDDGVLALNITVKDDSHNHVISNIDGLQAALDAKLLATANAVSSSKWATARTITLSGDASGSVSIDGSANVTLSVTVKDDSHNHVISNIDGLQAALDAKLPKSGGTMSGDLTLQKANGRIVIYETDYANTNSGIYWKTNDGAQETFLYQEISDADLPAPGQALILASNNSGSHPTHFVIDGDFYATTNKYKVWHAGTFDPSTKLGATANAVSASKWATARTITLSGDATGSVSIDGSSNVSLNVSVNDNSHNHTNYVEKAGSTLTGSMLFGGANFQGIYWGSKYEDDAAHEGAWSYIRQHPSLGPGYMEIGVDATLNIYETDARGLAISIDANAKTLDAIGGLKENGTALSSKYLGISANAVSASKWVTARTLTLTGDATGSASIDGSASITLNVNVVDDSHNHVISNIDGLQAALDAKLLATANAVSASKWATARTLSLTGDATGSVSIDGSSNVSLSVTVIDDLHNHVISNIDGLQAALDAKLLATANAVSASKWATARTLSLTGDATGSTSFDGTGNVSITVTVANNSHAHTIANVTGLTDALTLKVPTSDVVTTATANKILKLDANAKLPASITGNAATATKLATARTIALSGDAVGSITFDGSANKTITVSIDGSNHSHTVLSYVGKTAATFEPTHERYFRYIYLNNTDEATYIDKLGTKGYVDIIGMSINLSIESTNNYLAFDKETHTMRHVQASKLATNWDSAKSKTLAYRDDFWVSNAGLNEDLNDLDRMGCYWYGPSTPNRPIDGAYGRVHTLPGVNDYGADGTEYVMSQIAISLDNQMHIRSNVQAQWGLWNRVLTKYDLGGKAGVSDLNNFLEACQTQTFIPDTLNSPVAGRYGIVENKNFDWANWGPSVGTTAWQIAYDTYSEMYMRRNVNNEGWGSWGRIIQERDNVTYIDSELKIRNAHGVYSRHIDGLTDDGMNGDLYLNYGNYVNNIETLIHLYATTYLHYKPMIIQSSGHVMDGTSYATAPLVIESYLNNDTRYPSIGFHAVGAAGSTIHYAPRYGGESWGFSAVNNVGTYETFLTTGYMPHVAQSFYFNGNNLANNTTLPSGMYTTNNGNVNISSELRGDWYHCLNMQHHDKNGFNAQIVTDLNRYCTELKIRGSNNGTWTKFKDIFFEGNYGVPRWMNANETFTSDTYHINRYITNGNANAVYSYTVPKTNAPVGTEVVLTTLASGGVINIIAGSNVGIYSYNDMRKITGIGMSAVLKKIWDDGNSESWSLTGSLSV